MSDYKNVDGMRMYAPTQTNSTEKKEAREFCWVNDKFSYVEFTKNKPRYGYAENSNWVKYAEASKLQTLLSVTKKTMDFLDNNIATLPCESRQRDLPESDWENLMYLRDQMFEALAEFSKLSGGEG